MTLKPAGVEVVFSEREAGDNNSALSKASDVAGVVVGGAFPAGISCTNVSNAFEGKSGLKLGSKNNPGSVTLQFAQKVKKIEITAKQFGSDTGKIAINGNNTTDTLTEEGVTIKYTFDTSVNEIIIATSTKRAYIVSFTVFYE